ncbi:Unknown protein sequence [Pseudomonas syringae pv. syringae]|nr:Unknown protein sequence [Pseudomonas syringae pv. syringae]
MSKTESRNRISVDLKFAMPALSLHLLDIQLPSQDSVVSR